MNGHKVTSTHLYLVASSSKRVTAWADVLKEEGYTVHQVSTSAKEATKPDDGHAYALVTIGLTEDQPLASLLSIQNSPPKVAIHYAPETLSACGYDSAASQCHTLFHLAEDQAGLMASLAALPSEIVSMPPSSKDDDTAEEPLPLGGKAVRVHSYPLTQQSKASIWASALPFSTFTAEYAFSEEATEWDRSAAGMSYTRNVELIKKHIGPDYELEKLWERHTRYEFEARDAEQTMKTMIPNPYVNHVACMTGGSGYEELHRFYTYNFVTRSPPDTEMVPISRTIGADRIVDEMVFRCTHTCEVEYFLPGIQPTGRKIEIFMVAIVNFRGPKLAFESIYWDQASVLVQLGLLDPKNLPCAGAAVGQKVLDPYRQPSNTLFGKEAKERAAGKAPPL